MTMPSASWRGHPAPGLRARLTTALHRARAVLLCCLPILLALAALGLAGLAWRDARVNRTIAGLAEGRDLPVAGEAATPLLLARALFLGQRDRLVEAEPLVEAIERRGDAQASARARYILANARLKQALTHLTRNETDPAGPLVVLARQDYKRALQARPDFWDAKFNYDFASRLIRDFPEFERKQGDDLEAEPKKIWTDIPGQPRGGP